MFFFLKSFLDLLYCLVLEPLILPSSVTEAEESERAVMSLPGDAGPYIHKPPADLRVRVLCHAGGPDNGTVSPAVTVGQFNLQREEGGEARRKKDSRMG